MSSHIHGEGEYINFINGHDLIQNIKTQALCIAGGIIPTALKSTVFDSFNKVDGILIGDSEKIPVEVADIINSGSAPRSSNVPGLIWRGMDNTDFKSRGLEQVFGDFGNYDYSIFDESVLTRPYRGSALKAVDYEISRGCPFTCSYCVETVVQKAYGFHEVNELGVLTQASAYLRAKKSEQVVKELVNYDLGVQLIRFQDTNFLSINRQLLRSMTIFLEPIRQ